MSSLTLYPVWQKLCHHQQAIASTHMRDLFAKDANRFNKFSLKFSDLLLDYSKHRIDDKTLPMLMQLAREANIEGWRDRMFTGDKINITENRAVLHTANLPFIVLIMCMLRSYVCTPIIYVLPVL